MAKPGNEVVGRKTLLRTRLEEPVRVLLRELPWLDRHVRAILKRIRAARKGAPPPKKATKKSGIFPRPSVFQSLQRIKLECAGLSVVIPAYNAPDELSICLRSVLRHTPRDVRIIVIDDASPDPRVQKVLSQYRAAPGLEIHANETNLGFTRTVNKGIELAGRDDVVLLNADTEVTPRWLTNLQLACYASERTATATAMSNNAGAFSVPKIGECNAIPDWLPLDAYARAISFDSGRVYPGTPTGNGFCLYIRRACLEEIGLFDADAFPRGYGEENDFCMRAGLKGWSHVVDDGTLVRHTRSASFGKEKVELMREGRRRIDERYPSYTKEVSAFVNGEQLTSVHHGVETLLDRVRAKPADGRPRVLYVLSTRMGGTPQTNQDLMTALEDRVDAFVLHCDTRCMSLGRLSNGQVIEIRSFVLRNRLKGFPHRSEEYDREVADWMVTYGIELVHIRHISRHGLGLIDVAKTLRIPVVFSFHDFYTVCPSVNLLDETDRNCGGTCTSTDGDCAQPLWKEPDFPPLKHRAIHEWKRMLGGSLQLCDAFVTTSPSAAATLKANYPFLERSRFLIIPHGRDFAEMQQLSASIEPPGEPLRLLVPGNLSRAKGLGVVRDLSERAREHEIEMHLLGELNEKIEGPNVINHGPYQREEFARKVSEIRPHAGGIFSICQETFSHTLTELWSCGVPVIGFDIGAVQERMKRVGGGWLAAEPSAAGVLELLRTLRRRPELQKAALQKISAWQAGEGRHRDCHAMANEYYDVYRAALEARSQRGVQAPRRPRVAIMSPGTTTEGYRPAVAPGSTHVRLGEKTHDRLDRPVRYDWVSTDADPDWLASAFDAVIVQRTALDERAADDLIERCKGQCPLIVELDDFLLSDDVSWSSYRDYSGHREALKKLIGAASLVMTSTEELRSRLTQFNDRVAVVPNVLSERLWLAPLPEESTADPSLRVLRKPPQDGETRAMYMGTWTHGDDLNILKDAVEDVRGTKPNFRLFLVGVTKTREPWYEQLKAPNVNYPSFVKWFRRVAALMDFAVAPLVETEFNRAKSTIKLLEYAAADLPVIASEVPPYRDEIETGVTGLLAKNSPEAWAEALRFACNNPDEMREMAARFRQEVLTERLVGRQIPAFDAAVLSTIEEFRRMFAETGSQAGQHPESRSVELPTK